MYTSSLNRISLSTDFLVTAYQTTKCLFHGYIHDIELTNIPLAIINICIFDSITFISKCKIVIVGDGGVGKTSLLRLHKNGSFDNRYISTSCCQVSPITFYTNIGPIILQCWDITTSCKYGAFIDGYFVDAKAAIIMFDTTSRISYKAISYYHRDTRRVLDDDIPIIICGN